MKPAISVRGVSKRFRLGLHGHRSYRTLRESLVSGVRGAGRWARGTFSHQSLAPAGSEDLWALKDVDFDVRPGEGIELHG